MTMSPSRTTTQMLDGLHDQGDDSAWRLFDARYRPIILGVARRVGFDTNSAADIAQEVILVFVQGYREGRYERERGRLRSWLLGITRRKIAEAARAGRRQGTPRGPSLFDHVPDDDQLDTLWTTQRRAAILRTAIEELRRNSHFDAKTLEAFELIGTGNHAPGDVAAKLGMSRNDVYLAKSRVTTRVREMVAALEVSYDAET